jgi:DNA mismatch repair protein MutS
MRNEVVKFAGFPVVKAKEYIELLMRNNITVAMADQTGKDVASKTKLFVRNVTRIITPGTVLADDDFSAENTFLLCVEFPDFTDSEWKSKTLGLSWVDVSTGEFYLSESKVILNLMI